MQKGGPRSVATGSSRKKTASSTGIAASSREQSQQFVSFTSGVSVRIHVDSISLSLPANQKSK